jgi:hypothetical protein
MARKRKRRVMVMTMRKNRLPSLGLVKSFKSLMSSMKTTMIFGQTEMKVKIISNVLITRWPKKK